MNGFTNFFQVSIIWYSKSFRISSYCVLHKTYSRQTWPVTLSVTWIHRTLCFSMSLSKIQNSLPISTSWKLFNLQSPGEIHYDLWNFRRKRNSNNYNHVYVLFCQCYSPQCLHFTSSNKFLLLFSARSCLTLCDPMDCSMPGFSVLHHLSEFAQTKVWVSDAIQHLFQQQNFSGSYYLKEQYSLALYLMLI